MYKDYPNEWLACMFLSLLWLILGAITGTHAYITNSTVLLAASFVISYIRRTSNNS